MSDPNPDKEKRKIAIRKRQYEDGTVPAHEAAEERWTGRRIKYPIVLHHVNDLLNVYVG